MNLVELTSGGRPSGELLAWSEDESKKYLHGLVTECVHANKCEGHAVYCMHDDGPRKCGKLWGDGNLDGDCKLFETNKHFNGTVLGTFEHLLSLGLAKIEESEK